MAGVSGRSTVVVPEQPLNGYESQKRRDWNTFLHFLSDHKPPLTLSRCSGVHVIEFLKYLDQFGKTKVHVTGCVNFGQPNPPVPCACQPKQAWGSLDAAIGRLRAAYEENGGKPELNPFGARVVRLYMKELRARQAKARGITYERKRKRPKEDTAGGMKVSVAVNGGDGGGDGAEGAGAGEAPTGSTLENNDD